MNIIIFIFFLYSAFGFLISIHVHLFHVEAFRCLGIFGVTHSYFVLKVPWLIGPVFPPKIGFMITGLFLWKLPKCQYLQVFSYINSVEVVSCLLIDRYNFDCQDPGQVRRKGLRVSWLKKQNALMLLVSVCYLIASFSVPENPLYRVSPVLFLQRIHLLCPMGEG